ncbi:hypothetical protein LWP59_18495 [Amycolatopsis acidiphila]|uniref:UBC core domain-containing protein n=1 Tax=Amycolatopsis acidiphila TaxID=715473 RepID=A0A558A6X9_9PSEU|nr:hypothetical protein [Amycolatopsis acidiphila]TVT20011.1 hypothetical protein FNH06_22080 [Amycolatopsis acidiphila]UIJ63474.1 hypothetical protein LWP59_18495 [Amycolatopsis acidiphila]GHG68724.1 hypothetical protein GCM10017788_28720 [Amycolatopsis acidiphila]
MSEVVAARHKPEMWWECEPRRLERDKGEIAECCSDLKWIPQDAGRWEGRLPLWPFARPEPASLRQLLGKDGMPVIVRYSQAYPMVPPAIYPLSPEPDLIEYTQTRFHVMGDGSLCLLQDDYTWTGRESIVDLLMKAAGWRVEYALVKSGLVNAMTINGIVSDPSRDHLIEQAAQLTSNWNK